MTASRRAASIGAQKHALDLEQFLPYRLSVASNAVSRKIATAYADQFDLSIPEWRLVAVLSAHGGATQQDLVRATLMDKVAVSRASKLLESKGLVLRQTDAEDARALRLQLTRSGSDLYARIAPVALELESLVLKGFSQSEIALLHSLLRRLETAVTGAGKADKLRH